MTKPSVHAGPGFRFSARTLLLSIVPISFGVTALHNPTYAWAAVAVTATLLAIPAAVVAALFDIRRRRPIWLGFAVFAGGYLLLLFSNAGPLSTEHLNEWLLEQVQPGADYPADERGWTTSQSEPAAPDELRAKGELPARAPASHESLAMNRIRRGSSDGLFDIADSSGDSQAGPDPTGVGIASADTGQADMDEYDKAYAFAESFKETARCLWVWCFGGCGACLASYLAGRNPVDWPDTAPPASGEAACAAKWPRRVTFAFRAVFIIVLATAGGCALWNPTVALACITATTVAVVLIATSISAVFGNPRRRPFRVGFSVFCGGYFLLCGWVGSSPTVDTAATWFLNAAVTAKSLYYLHDHRFPDDFHFFPDGSSLFEHSMPLPVVGFQSPADRAMKVAAPNDHPPEHASLSGVQTQLWQVLDADDAPDIVPDQPPGDYWDNLLIAGHSAWALILGWLGGALARSLAARRSAGRPPALSVPVPPIG